MTSTASAMSHGVNRSVTVATTGARASVPELEAQTPWVHQHLAPCAVEPTAPPNDPELPVSTGDATKRLDVAAPADPAVEMGDETAPRATVHGSEARVVVTDALMVMPSTRIEERGPEPFDVVTFVERVISGEHSEVAIKCGCSGGSQGYTGSHNGQGRQELACGHGRDAGH